MTDNVPRHTQESIRALSDTELQLHYERARAAMQKNNQLALDSSEEEALFELYQHERDRRSKSSLVKDAEKGQ